MNDQDVPEPIRVIVSNEFNLGSKAPVTIHKALSSPNSEKLAGRIAELRKLSNSQHEALIAAIHAKHRRQNEAALFFSLPDAQANIRYWTKSPIWTAQEAVALSFGKSPDIVTQEKIAPYRNVSDFASAYMQRCALVERSVQAGMLVNPMPPADFLTWCDRYEESVPDALRSAVDAFWGKTAPSGQISAMVHVDQNTDAVSAPEKIGDRNEQPLPATNHDENSAGKRVELWKIADEYANANRATAGSVSLNDVCKYLMKSATQKRYPDLLKGSKGWHTSSWFKSEGRLKGWIDPEFRK